MPETIERLHPRDNGSLAVRDDQAVANSIIENDELALFCKKHNSNGTVYIDADLISFHYETTKELAKRAKKLLDSHVPADEIEDAAESEWAG